MVSMIGGSSLWCLGSFLILNRQDAPVKSALLLIAMNFTG